MSQAQQNRLDLSHVELLLDEQKYEAALTPLAKLIEEDPFDLQIRLYRLLAVRLLILNQILTQGTFPSVDASRRTVRVRLLDAVTSLRSAVSSCARNWIHSLQAARPTSTVRRGVLALALSALFVTAVIFCLGVADQQLSGAGIIALSGRSIEGADEQSRHALVNPIPSVHDIKGDEPKLRMLGRPPTSGALSNSKPTLDDRQAKAVKMSPKYPDSVARELQTIYKTKGLLSLRQEPRFASASLQQIAEGTRISVLGVNGNWLKVKPDHSRAVGYLRKEFLIVANGAP